jgi:hypothetical protein
VSRLRLALRSNWIAVFMVVCFCFFLFRNGFAVAVAVAFAVG